MATATAKLRPLGDRVVIQPTPREEMTKSGIVLPDTAKEKPQEGTVLSAGPGRLTDEGKREPMDVKEGDKVLYAKYAGTEFKVDGEELLIVSQKDILAVVEDCKEGCDWCCHLTVGAGVAVLRDSFAHASQCARSSARSAPSPRPPFGFIGSNTGRKPLTHG